jgi:hypothetical protein
MADDPTLFQFIVAFCAVIATAALVTIAIDVAQINNKMDR